jgi:hypothetical protein
MLHTYTTISTVLDMYLQHTNHIAFADHIISQNKTPIFEFISSNFQFTVHYKEPSLVLLAIRDNLTGVLFIFTLITQNKVHIHHSMK